MTSTLRLLALLCLVLLAGCETPPDIDCKLTMIAQIPLQVQDHLLVVPAGINGHWVHLVVDSGAERTMLSNITADRLSLPHDARYKVQSLGIGGSTTATDVTVDRLVLGDVHFPIQRIAVGNFTLQNGRGLDADGLLGADILLAFDMDIDVPDGKLTLYRPHLCPNVQPPWHEPWIEITGVRARKDRLLLPFELDGVQGEALLDTGAQGNVLGVNMARRMGLTEQVLATDPPVRNTGTGGVTISRLHRFKQLRIGPVVEDSPTLVVLPSDFGVGDALVGEQFLQGRRVWLSFKSRAVFVSPPIDRPMIDKLEMLLALAREQHFGRAAEACGVTQPTLSAGLKQLEESFGVLLVQRQSRFIGLTPEGLRVLDWSRRIVGDYRAMRDEIRALKRGLAGHLRIAAVPTALPIVSTLTTPLHIAHPDVVFTILSRNSIEILTMLDNLEIEAGLSYVDNEPLGRARAVPLYHEHYRLLIAADRPLGDRKTVTWAEVASIPLCLLTPDMQNRRIIDRKLRDAGAVPVPTLQSNSMVVLFSHVRTGQWASVMPAVLAETMGLPEPIRAIPIDDPAPPPTIGLIYPQREPLTPLTAALVTEARRIGPGWMATA